MVENQIVGTENDDILLDTSVQDEIFALGGNDEIETSSGNDIVHGDDGIDKLVINYSNVNEDLILLLQNYDNFSGHGSFDINFPINGNNNYLEFYSIEDFEIIVGSGNDVVDANTYYFNSVIDTGGGDDLILPGKGFKVIDGGSGFDTLDLSFYDSINGVTSNLSNSNSGEYISSDSSVEFSNIEAINVQGSFYDDVLVAVTGNNNDNPIFTTINGNSGFDELVVDYSDRHSDHNVTIDLYGGNSGNLNTYDYQTGNNNDLNFSEIEAFNVTTGRGNNLIDLGFDNYSDDTVNAGAGDDYISTGKGFDLVNGGSGYDLLSLDFINSINGVTSSLNDSNSGEYISSDSSVEFSNIEAINIQGSFYDDVLVAVTGNNNDNPIPTTINGNDGFDELVVDYSDRHNDHDVTIDVYNNSLNTYDFQTGINDTTLNFSDIEAFNVTTGRGNNLIDLGYDNFTDDTVNTGAGDDNIFTGKGFDLVDGGSGFDVLNLDFINSINGVTSSLNDSTSGEYISSDSNVEFSNIEAVNVQGSFYDDVLIAATGNSNNNALIPTTINGNDGFDELVVDYSDRHNDHNVTIDLYGGNSGNFNTYDYQTGIGDTTIDFSDIEAFNVTTGRGDNFLDLGYDNFTDDTVNTGAGDDNISTGKGFDLVDGGSGFDVLNLDFYNSVTGVTSSLNDSNSGEYIGSDSNVEFKNIEAINVFGSTYDDILVATTGKSNNVDNPIPIPIIDGREGFDELVVDYSDRNSDLNFYFNSTYYDFNGDDISVSGNLDISQLNDPTLNETINFNNIESFNITGSRGDDNVDLGYDNYSDDTVNTGAGDDYISTGKGFDVVDGGSGFDVLNLDFTNNVVNGVTSSLTNGDNGEYIGSEGTIEFSNIEAINVFGSSYDDVLVAITKDDDINNPIPTTINGNSGYDELVVDYSDRHNNHDVIIDIATGNLNIHDYQTGNNSNLNFSDIEAFNVTTGRGNNFLDLGYDNFTDDTVNTGAGDDNIFTGKGFDLVDGGSGFDVLNLDFYNSISGVTSSLNDSNSGEYNSSDSSVEFTNIEAINVQGSSYDDVLVAATGNGSNNNPIPTTINGNSGYDELVVDYSDRHNDYDVIVDSYSGNLNTHNFQTGINDTTLNFSEIEAFNITTGRGNNLIDLGFDNFCDDTVNTGAGDDSIFTGKGFDLVDGGSGFDVLNLDFYNSVNGVTSSLNDNNSGEYVGSDSNVEFSNIEAINVFGSTYDDVLVAATGNGNSNNRDTVPFSIPIIDGREGYDELVVDYSDRNSDLNININSTNYYPDGNNTSVSGSLDTNLESINFNSIEGFDLSVGRGNDNIELGYDNFSDDTVDAGGGNDYISTGKGFDIVDGGSGFDVLNLDFYNSVSGVTSSLNDRNSGEYISNEGASENSVIEFSNIEAINVQGSQYDDVLVAIANLSNQGTNPISVPNNSYIDGGSGFDELVVDYSDSKKNLDIINVNNYSGNSGELNVFHPKYGNQNQISFNDVESLNITTGAGNNNIDLGYENLSNDLIDAGAGNDYISTGKGSDVVDGGSGYDTLHLDFSNSNNGITSNLSSSNSGEYISDESSIEFKNIEAINVTGSAYDDVLIAATGDRNFADSLASYVEGGSGYDELVVDYSNLPFDSNIYINSNSDTSGSINVYSPETGDRTILQFNDIETITMISNNGSEASI